MLFATNFLGMLMEMGLFTELHRGSASFVVSAFILNSVIASVFS